MTRVSRLGVKLYGKEIGVIDCLPGERTMFHFHDSYVDDSNRPTLGLAFKDEYGELRQEFRAFRMQLMPFFSNLLPEGHLREYLARRAGVKSVREFHLLRALGSDLPGAVVVETARDESEPGDATESDSTSVDGGGTSRLRNSQQLRFSLAGVQLKLSAILNSKKGLTIPAHGRGGDWIVKTPSPAWNDLCENEFSVMTLAGMIGMNVPEIRLLDVDDIANLPDGLGEMTGQAFAIRRFDRSDDGALVHVEDFAQIFEVFPDDKYSGSFSDVARVIASECDQEDIEEFIRRLTFNLIIGNGDMHLKNWSLIYRDRRKPSLAPAYDFVSTVPHIPNEDTGMKICRFKNFSQFTVAELERLAAKASIPSAMVRRIAGETAELTRQIWAQQRHNLPLSKKVREAIDAHIRSAPLTSQLA